MLEQVPDFPAIKEGCLTILNSRERIAYPSIRGQYIYNFWQGETSERGRWRRTSREEYFRTSPAWEVLLDLDALSEAENEKWSFKGVSVLAPDFDIGMVKLSRGGSDAVEMREFDLKNKKFVSNGFFVKQAKISVSWLSRGGEFGPSWHQAARKENRQRSFDDFISVSEDLIRRGICSRKTLGIRGGSNGGLLVGAVAMQRPELYNAVVCSVPLLDMKRFNKLLAGASWMGEYGNPDIPEEWAYLRKYSPYHNVAKDRHYPEMLFITSTRDDRVHPAHARKMAARMEAFGHDIHYYENTEGGHGAGVTNGQRANILSPHRAALISCPLFPAAMPVVIAGTDGPESLRTGLQGWRVADTISGC